MIDCEEYCILMNKKKEMPKIVEEMDCDIKNCKYYVVDIEPLLNINTSYSHAGPRCYYPSVKKCHVFTWLGYMHLRHIHIAIMPYNQMKNIIAFTTYNGIVDL